MGIVSLVLGILATVFGIFCCIPGISAYGWIGIILGVIGILTMLSSLLFLAA